MAKGGEWPLPFSDRERVEYVKVCVQKGIDKLKCGKVAGIDEITAEFLK